jgi:hypothetical protein
VSSAFSWDDLKEGETSELPILRRSSRKRSKGRKLQMTVWHTDSGNPKRSSAFTNYLATKRLLVNDNKVYCTDPRSKKKKNFNVCFIAQGHFKQFL